MSDQLSELEKVIAARPVAGELAKFLTWLYRERQYRLCKEYEFGYAPELEISTADLIADFLNLNLEAARDEVLDT